MPKINFKRLTRGVALLREHIHSQISSGLLRLTNTGVTEDNLERNEGTFRVNLSFPWVPGDDQAGAKGHGSVSAPFTLPPLQEFWSPTGTPNATTPQIVLDEVCVSFDQRGEGAAITQYYSHGGIHTEEGELDFAATDKLNLRLSIFSKEMQIWSGAAATDLTGLEYSLEAPGVEFFGGEKLRLNPMTTPDLEKVIDPYRTYMLEARFTDLPQQTAPPLEICSLLVSLRFRSKLIPRDLNVAPSVVQNMPPHNGVLNTSPVTIASPGAADVITADNATTGVSTVMQTIDTVFRQKLNAGYNAKSLRADAERVVDNASYEVIAVPMFGNRYAVRGGTSDADSLPYTGASPFQGETGDRRVIPIHYPMTVHHVIAAVNYTQSNSKGGDGVIPAASSRPSIPALANTVGVGIGSGLRSDGREYRQVALGSWTANNAASIAALRIDQIGANGETGHHWDLMAIPLTYVTGAASSKGYPSITTGGSNQGHPYFVGQTDSKEMARSPQAALVNGAAFPNFGREQFIEVRWNIQDTAGMGTVASYPSSEPVVGHGGHWVFIIGKKHLA